MESAAETVWVRIIFASTLVAHTTEKSILIKMPASSRYAGFEFWTARKFVHPGRYALQHCLSIPASFKITLRGEGRNVIISADRLADELAFYNEEEEWDEGYVPPDEVLERLPKWTVKHTPRILKPETEVKPDASLIR